MNFQTLSLYPMKSVFKILLFTLISCCYLNTVFEFSDKEKKANFENETHCYIQLDNQTHTFTCVKTVKQLDNVIIGWLPEISIPGGSSNAVGLSQYKYYSPPPERRYILYASLLI